MKRQYYAYLAEAQGRNEQTIDAVAKAIAKSATMKTDLGGAAQWRPIGHPQTHEAEQQDEADDRRNGIQRAHRIEGLGRSEVKAPQEGRDGKDHPGAKDVGALQFSIDQSLDPRRQPAQVPSERTAPSPQPFAQEPPSA